MVDKADLIETAELELDRLVMVMHQSGLSYWQILKLWHNYCVKLQMLAEVERLQS